jgi:hypothetical protein
VIQVTDEQAIGEVDPYGLHAYQYLVPTGPGNLNLFHGQCCRAARLVADPGPHRGHLGRHLRAYRRRISVVTALAI